LSKLTVDEDGNVSRRNSFIVSIDNVVELETILKREELVSKPRER
jgi:hypothetical protein